MKKLITVILLFISLTSISQMVAPNVHWWVGFKYDDIYKNMTSFKEWQFSTGSFEDGAPYMKFKNTVSGVILYCSGFNSIGQCTACMINVGDNTSLKKFEIEQLNNDDVIISDTEWKSYEDGYIIDTKFSQGIFTFVLYSIN